MIRETMVALSEVERTIRERSESAEYLGADPFKQGVQEGLSMAANYVSSLPDKLDAYEWRCSELPRLLACPGSQNPDIGVAADNEAARLGTAVHAILGCKVKGFPVDEYAVAAKHRVELDDVTPLVARGYRSWKDNYQPFFTNPLIERFLTAHKGTDHHNEHPWVLTGHIDVHSINGREARILDWKTGWADEDHDDQLRGYAYLMFRNYDIDRVYAAVDLVRLGERDGCYYTRKDIEEWWKVSRMRLFQRGNFATGRQCRYCPRGPTCHAKGRLLAQAASALVGSYQTTFYPQSARGLMEFYDQLRLVKDAIDKAKEVLDAEVNLRGGKIEFPDGRVLESVTQTQRKIDYKSARDLLVSLIGDEEVANAVTLRKKDIDRAIKDTAPNGSKGAYIAHVYEQLENAGALNVTQVHRLEVRKREPVANASANAGTKDAESLGREGRLHNEPVEPEDRGNQAGSPEAVTG